MDNDYIIRPYVPGGYDEQTRQMIDEVTQDTLWEMVEEKVENTLRALIDMLGDPIDQNVQEYSLIPLSEYLLKEDDDNA